MSRRVAITGLGAVTPVGSSVKESWDAVKNGWSGVARITLFDASNYPVKIAAEVKNFDITKYGIEHRAVRKMARFTQFLLSAAVQAIADSNYSKDSLQKEKSAIVIGNCLGGQDAVQDGYDKFTDPKFGPHRMPPLTTPMSITNEAAANLSIFFGLQGPCLTIGTACASGTDAIGCAADMIKSGRADVCISGGTEASINGFNVASYNALSALSYHYNDNPEIASRPFDRDRDGFVLGEGSAVLILEELEHAKKRGAHIYAEIAGYGSSCDAFNIVSPSKDGSGAAIAVRSALEDAGLKPEDILYYNAHGTSTMTNDIAESCMLKTVFKNHAYKLHISSTKSVTGHMVGAAGAIEAIFCVKAINDSFVPPTINLQNPDVEHGCDLDYTPNNGIKCNILAAASASLGFGGHNSCIIIKKYTE